MPSLLINEHGYLETYLPTDDLQNCCQSAQQRNLSMYLDIYKLTMCSS